MTPHNEANFGEIAKNVIMAGDPLRVKYIAEKYLEDAKLVNKVRGMYCYTGKYKDKEISVMAHGMGMPSMGIYSYELFNIYDVDTIIRIGSCGAISEKLNLKDLILVTSTYTEGNYAYNFDNVHKNIAKPSDDINKIIKEVAEEKNIKYVEGMTLCNECFDVYLPDKEALVKRANTEEEMIATEMEAFALFYNAQRENKKSACILTVVDVPKESKGMTPEERETSLNNMILLALESAVKV